MNINQPLVSIIIPVYNVEKYLERCVNSVIEQSYKNLEIFLIDDGSLDSSGLIADSLANADKRIKVVHQKNKGLSGARNTGIKQATGEWIMFVDSDDYIDLNMVKTLLDLAQDNNADMAASNVEKVSDNGHIGYYGDTEEQCLLTSKEALTKLAVNHTINNSAHNKLIKTKIVKNHLFREGIMFEDCDVMYKWMNEANKLVYTGSPFYKYYLSSQSLLRGKFNPKSFDYIEVAKNKIAFYEKECPEAAPIVKANLIEELLYVAYRSRKEKEYRKQNKEVIDFVKSIIHEKQYTSYSRKNRLKINCFRAGKHFYYCMMNLYERLFRKY